MDLINGTYVINVSWYRLGRLSFFGNVQIVVCLKECRDTVLEYIEYHWKWNWRLELIALKMCHDIVLIIRIILVTMKQCTTVSWYSLHIWLYNYP